MSNCGVIMTCPNGHQWATVGLREVDGRISLGICSVEGAEDDPTCCSVCRQPAQRITVLDAAKRRRTGRVRAEKQLTVTAKAQ